MFEYCCSEDKNLRQRIFICVGLDLIGTMRFKWNLSNTSAFSVYFSLDSRMKSRSEDDRHLYFTFSNKRAHTFHHDQINKEHLP